MPKTEGFYCATCGEFHEGLPLDFGFQAPDPYLSIPEEERGKHCILTQDICVLEGPFVLDGPHFFIRGCLQIPIVAEDQPFVWGVWASLSEKNFRRSLELWDSAERVNEPPYFGWLCNRLPIYQDTLYLKTHVHTRSAAERPLIELEPTDHPLAVDQRNGITLARVQELVERLLHPPSQD